MGFNPHNSPERSILPIPFYGWSNWGQRGREARWGHSKGKKSCQGLNSLFAESPFFSFFFWKFGKTCLTPLLLFSNLFILCSGLGGHNCAAAISYFQLDGEHKCPRFSHKGPASHAPRELPEQTQYPSNLVSVDETEPTPPTPTSFPEKLTTEWRPAACPVYVRVLDASPHRPSTSQRNLCWLSARWIQSLSLPKR